MRTTVFERRSGVVATDVREEPDWQPFGEYDGKPLERVRVQEEDTLLSVCLVRQRA